MKMKRRIGVLIMIVVMLISLTGCWNRKELNKLGIVLAMGIDKKEDRYQIYLQIVNPSEVASKKASGLAPVTLYQATGATIIEAVRRVTEDLPRVAYLSHLRMLIFGEEISREGIGKALDFLSRYHEMRTNFYIVVSKGAKIESILGHYTGLVRIPANKLFDALETSERSFASTGTITLDKLITDITVEGKQPVLTGIKVLGDKEEGKTKDNDERIQRLAHLQYTGFAVFKEDKLQGWLNEEESKGYNFTQGKVKSTSITVSCPKGGKLSVEIIRTKAKIKGRVEGGQPKADVEVRAEGNIAEVECDIDLTQRKSIDELEKKVKQKIKGHIEMALKKTQKNYKSDIFGFGQAIYRADPKAWKTMKEHWDEQYFTDLPVNIEINMELRRLGTTTNSFIEKIKE